MWKATPAERAAIQADPDLERVKLWFMFVWGGGAASAVYLEVVGPLLGFRLSPLVLQSIFNGVWAAALTLLFYGIWVSGRIKRRARANEWARHNQIFDRLESLR